MPQHTIKRLPWTLEEDNLLRNLMATKRYSFPQMALHFPGRNGRSLRKHALVHLGLQHDGFVFRKHSYNQSFFETPNPVNCYVAGYYAADGCITDNPTTRVLALALAPIEKHQLETFKTLMGYTGQIALDHYEGRNDIYALRLYGAHKICADLERNFGLTPRKTHRIPAPNLTDEHLKLCYLAGLLDGDGCVHINNVGGIVIRYVSCSEAIVNWVKEFTDSLGLKNIARNTCQPTVRPLTEANAWAYQIGGLKALDLIRRIQKLKSEGVPVLDRKWDNERLNAYITAFEEKHGILI